MSRCCSTRTSRPRGTTSSRSAPPRSAWTATSWPTRWTSRATSDTRCGSRTYAPATLYDDEIVGIGAGATWAADNRTVYYTTVDEAWRPDTVWRHRIGSGLPAERVYHEPDERFWLAVGRTRSDKYVIIAAGSAVTSEVRYGDAADSQAEFTPVWPRRELVEYSVEHAVVGGEDRFLILHNDGAENFTLVEAPVSRPHVVPHADRAPRRRATGLRRRVRGAPGGRLPQRGAAADPALADLRRRTYGHPEDSPSTPS